MENPGRDEPCDSRGVLSRSVAGVAILPLQTRSVRDRLGNDTKNILIVNYFLQGPQSTTERRPHRSCISVDTKRAQTNSTTGRILPLNYPKR